MDCETLTVVDAEIWIVAILILATYADDATVGKLCVRSTKTNEAPRRVFQGCKRVLYIFKSYSSIPCLEASWANLENPEGVVHDRRVGCSPYVGLSVGVELVASDLKRILFFFWAVALEKFTGMYLGGRHGVIGFSDRRLVL